MASIKRAAAAIAAILVREGVDYAQSKAVFKAARERAGLRTAPEHRGGVDRLTVEEELRFLDQAYARDGRTGLMLQTLLETGARARTGAVRPAANAVTPNRSALRRVGVSVGCIIGSPICRKKTDTTIIDVFHQIKR
jgi:hypothetical protein